MAGLGPSMLIPLVIGVNPLQTTLFELGIVSGRVVLLLRSAEIQPVFVRFVPNRFGDSPPSLLVKCSSREGAAAVGRACAKYFAAAATIGPRFIAATQGKLAYTYKSVQQQQ